MLTYDLNNRGNLPKYVYLYQCIRGDIIDGVLRKGEKLPSKRALASHLGVAVITVVNAYEQLLTEGFIVSREKRGYFVQDLSSFSIRNKTGSEEKVISAPEKKTNHGDYFVDFKANRTGLRHFPVTKWNYYMRQALSLQDDTLLRTVPYNGLYELRAAIARYLYRERGMEVSPEQIIIGAGTEYLYSRLIQLFGRACTFASEDPGYKKFAAIAASYGNPWIYVPIDSRGLRVDLLEEYGADVVHVSPANHFPTGLVMPVTRRIELFEWVNRVQKRYIIEDDYDCEFRYSGKLILPMFSEDTQDKVIYLNTFSKTLVPSLRISYMVLPPKLIRRYESTMSFYSCTVSSFEQYTLARFIDDGELERHINRMRNYYKKQRALILETIRESPLAGISTIYENNAGTHFLLQVKTDRTNEEIREEGLRQEMQLSFYSEYSHRSESGAGNYGTAAGEEYRGADNAWEGDRESSCTLVINYAGIASDRVREVV